MDVQNTCACVDAERVIRVDGSDRSLTKARAEPSPNIEYRRGDVTTMDMSALAIDIASSRFLLTHPPEPAGALSQRVRHGAIACDEFGLGDTAPRSRFRFGEVRRLTDQLTALAHDPSPGAHVTYVNGRDDPHARLTRRTF